LKIYFDNIDLESTSGPNSFGRKLYAEFNRSGNIATKDKNEKDIDVCLSFIDRSRYVPFSKKYIQRLDGIWFNTKQEWQKMNMGIQMSYKTSDAVIFQSSFDRHLINEFFGEPKQDTIIYNGSQYIGTKRTEKSRKEEVRFICCADWRPHKRLRDAVDLFIKMNIPNSYLMVVGSNPDYVLNDPRIIYTGFLNQEKIYDLYQFSDYLIHLAWLDHCPNSVVEAICCGCNVICSSSGGTPEIVKSSGFIVEDEDFDFRPTDLYNPPKLNIDLIANNLREKIAESKFEDRYDLSIEQSAKEYISFFESILNNG